MMIGRRRGLRGGVFAPSGVHGDHGKNLGRDEKHERGTTE